MVCYEATNDDQYMKIAKFIGKQPAENPCFMSWRVGHPQSTVGFIRHCKDTRENYLIFWCEDDKGNVRAAHSIEAHPTGFGDIVATQAYAIMDSDDMKNGDMTYYREIIDYMVRVHATKWNSKRGEFWVAPHLAEWTKKVFEGCYEVTRKAMFMGQELQFLIVDFAKYLEVHP